MFDCLNTLAVCKDDDVIWVDVPMGPHGIEVIRVAAHRDRRGLAILPGMRNFKTGGWEPAENFRIVAVGPRDSAALLRACALVQREVYGEPRLRIDNYLAAVMPN